MKKYFIDLETKSDVDISKAGAYRYADSPNFDILLFAYSVNGSPVRVIDLASGEHIPMEIIKDIVSDDVQKHAFNAQFERVCLSAYIRRNYPQYFTSYSIDEDTVGDYLNPQSWRCTMVASAYLGLPLHLAGVGEVLNIEQKKMFEGKALIKYFCVPYEYIGDKPLFHKPSDAPDKWAVFKAYNKRDVEAEMDIGWTSLMQSNQYMGQTCGLECISLPLNLTKLGKAALAGNKFEEVTVPRNVTEVGDYCFESCCELLEATVLGTVIGNFMFVHCNKMTQLRVTTRLARIGSDAFNYCSQLTTIIYDGTVTQWQAVQKASDWACKIGMEVGISGLTTVECSDGHFEYNTESKEWEVFMND